MRTSKQPSLKGGHQLLGALRAIVVALIYASAHAEPPKNSWEAWLSRLYEHSLNSKTLTRPNAPDRPDGQAPGSPLPLWVDCHLGWAFDHGRVRPPRGIVLRGDATSCKGQLEEWAR